MASSIRSASSLLLAALPLLAASASAAEPKPRAAATKKEDPEAVARRVFEQAQREYDLGNFEKALEGYSEAYRLVSAPALLFNIGQCHRQLGRYERAAFFYRRYLALEPDSPDAPMVTGLIQQMEAKQAESAQARTPAAPTPLEVPLKPEAPPAAGRPSLLRNGWFWAGVGVLAAGAATTAVLLTSGDGRPQPGLGTVTVP
ncbi:MAG TPA: tetratricopeptide repeat protein [Myxococcus sp.]|nr:tetratricopeptide repeat protein [Myxococcus sp.]